MPPDRLLCPPHPADAALLLQAVALPLLQLGADAQVLWASAAAATALGAQPGQPLGALWVDPIAASGLCAGAAAELDLQAAHGAQPWFRTHSQPLPGGGWLLTLQPADALRAAQAEVQRQAEWLELAGDFGRLGLWERNVRTLNGHWDREARRFWGLDAEQLTPDFEAAIQSIAAADREAVRSTFQSSLKQAGRYAMRYRVRARDGTLRRIHSQWLVKNGADGAPERVLGLMMDDSEPYALAQSTSELESQLALAADMGGISIWRHDLASGRTHYSLQGWRSLGLMPRPEGLSLDEVRAMIHPDDLARVQASASQALASSQPVDVDARYRHADGSWRPQLLRRTVLRDDAGTAIALLGVALDVTERLEARRHADDMTRRFETVTRAAGIGHWIIEPGQTHAVWSDQLRVIYGLAPAAPVPSLGEWLQRFIHPDDRDRLKQTARVWLQGGSQRIDMSFRAIRGDGEVRQLFTHSHLEAGAAGPLVFGVVIDLTEQRRSEWALKSAEQRVALATRGAGLGTWEQDPISGDVHWDAQMWRLRGHAPQPSPMTEEQRAACVHPDDRERAVQQIQQAVADGGAFDHEFRVVWPDGQVRWLASRSAELPDPQGGLRRRIGVNWDVTDSRTAAAVRHERELALRESASKSKFLARISHELRTPLNAVLGFSQLLLTDEVGTDASSSARRRRLDHIRAAGQHLLTLINDVLELSGLDGGELPIALQSVCLQTVVAQTLPLLGPQQQQVQLAFGDLAHHVMADATRLSQVLLNLLSNAVKYNRVAGSVSIEARREGASVVLRVTDTGRGLSAEQLQQVFEPFNRLGAQGEAIEGTGIGLAIVKSLMARMGGSVRVDSQVDVGSVFELRLAAAPVPVPVPVPVPAPAPAPAPVPAALGAAREGAADEAPAALAETAAGVRRTVLYIEDNPVNALILSELMARRRDLSLHLAVDGASGVSRARALRPDLILLDMQLPDFDGYEVLRRLRLEPLTAGIPCIALSANAMPEDIQRARRAGVADYWTKPLDFGAFLASLDLLFGQAPVTSSP